MGLISRKENRVRQRREAAQHTTPMQGLPTEKRALSRRAKTQMYSKDRQRRVRGENRDMLTGNASGGFCKEKLLVRAKQKQWQVLSCTHQGGRISFNNFLASGPWHSDSFEQHSRWTSLKEVSLRDKDSHSSSHVYACFDMNFCFSIVTFVTMTSSGTSFHPVGL